MLKKHMGKLIICLIILIVLVTIFHLVGSNLGMVKSHFGM